MNGAQIILRPNICSFAEMPLNILNTCIDYRTVENYPAHPSCIRYPHRARPVQPHPSQLEYISQNVTSSVTMSVNAICHPTHENMYPIRMASLLHA